MKNEYFFLSLIELNRKETRLLNYEKISVLLIALIIGVDLGVSGFEGSFNGFNQNYLIIPIAAILLYKIYKYKTSFTYFAKSYPSIEDTVYQGLSQFLIFADRKKEQPFI